jgi:hypothetical protein
MIFIGGVGPRRKRLEAQSRICSNCGLSQAYLTRIDNYLSLFFMPVLRIRKGEPFIQCERCGHVTDEKGRISAPGMDLRGPCCSRCGASLDGDFRFCPYCGAPR